MARRGYQRSMSLAGPHSRTRHHPQRTALLDPCGASLARAPLSLATDIQCRDPADARGAHPPGKGVGFDTFRVVPPTHRAEHLSPRVVVQLWRAGNAVALKHYRLRFWSASVRTRSKASDWAFLRSESAKSLEREE